MDSIEQRIHNMTYLPDEWTEFNGDYKKCIQSIRLKNGTEYEKCYPNAGIFLIFSGKELRIPISEVTHVKNYKLKL